MCKFESVTGNFKHLSMNVDLVGKELTHSYSCALKSPLLI